MRFPLIVPCRQCGSQITVETTGNERYPNAHCVVCDSTIWVFDDGRVSYRVFARSSVEFDHKDWSLAIILSAMSVETEMAYLYSKWRAIDSNLLPSEITALHTDAWEEEFRKLYNVGNRLDSVCKLLTGETFDSFLSQRPTLLSGCQPAQSISGRLPREFFVEELFWRRNKILHSGKVQFGESEAGECVEMARVLLGILDEMDKARNRKLKKDHADDPTAS
jgi:hypothetical protein